MGRNQKKILIILGTMTAIGFIFMLAYVESAISKQFLNQCIEHGFHMVPEPTANGYCFNVAGTPNHQMNVPPFNDTCAPYPKQARWTPSPTIEGFCQNWYGTYIPLTPTSAGD